MAFSYLSAKVEGEQFFDQIPGLCQAVASLCTISCVTSLMTIAVMGVNRYFYICAHDQYERIFKKWNCICMCISLYFVGGILVLLNAVNIGDHGFDRKSLECIWDRMATFQYTIAFSIMLVWIPSVVTGLCYLKIYLYVRGHRNRLREQGYTDNTGPCVRSFRLARTLFIIYAVFVTCWAPYALLIVTDSHDNFPHEIHVYITMFAHMHPSLNWLIYCVTNKKFASAYRSYFTKCRLCLCNASDVASSMMSQTFVARLFARSKQSYTSTRSNAIEERHEKELSYLSISRLNTAQDENSNIDAKQRILMETMC